MDRSDIIIYIQTFSFFFFFFFFFFKRHHNHSIQFHKKQETSNNIVQYHSGYHLKYCNLKGYINFQQENNAIKLLQVFVNLPCLNSNLATYSCSRYILFKYSQKFPTDKMPVDLEILKIKNFAVR